MPERLPGEGEDWVRLRGDQGWRDVDGMMWRRDCLYKDHWDVTDPRTGTKVREVTFDGRIIWPDGPKQRGKQP